MKYAYAVLATTLLLSGLAFQDADAQSRRDRASESRREDGSVYRDRDGNVIVQSDRRRDDDDDRWDDWDDDNDRYERRDRKNQKKRKNAPAFCESGAGHPVYGRDWCYEKGYEVGRDRRDRRWEDASIGDIIFGSPRKSRRDRRTDRLESGSVLRDILGRSVYDRLYQQSRRLGYDGSLQGRWLSPDRLQIVAGNAPFARLTDTNRDGRVDRVQLYR